MNGMDADQIAKLIEHRKWVALAIPVIWYLTRLVKADIRIFPTVDPRWRIFVALVLSIASGVLEKVVEGKTWTSALVGAAITWGGAVLFQETFIASLRGGKEFPVPWITEPNTRPAPTAPVTIPTRDAPPSIVLLPLPGDAKTPVPSGSDSDVTRHSPNNED